MLLVIGLSYTPKVSGILTCWDTWSRCTTWSNDATGLLWIRCQECCQCKGYYTGECRLIPATCSLSKKAFRCHCSGEHTGEKPLHCKSLANVILGC